MRQREERVDERILGGYSVRPRERLVVPKQNNDSADTIETTSSA